MPLDEQLQTLNKQLINAGIIGSLRGTLIGLVSGFYFSYRYNHGPNARFFSAPYKLFYLISWNIAGIIFTTDIAKNKLRHQTAMEEQLRQEIFLQEEMANGRR